MGKITLGQAAMLLTAALALAACGQIGDGGDEAQEQLRSGTVAPGTDTDLDTDRDTDGGTDDAADGEPGTDTDEEPDESTGDADDGLLETEIPEGYAEVTDTNERLLVVVPEWWSDTQTEPSGQGTALTVAPDVGDYLVNWAADGMKLTVRQAADPVDSRSPMEETIAAAECQLVSSEPYDDGLYTGTIDRYEQCGGTSTAVVIGATDAEEEFEILVEVQFDTVDTETDDETLDLIIRSFQVR